MYSLQSMNVFSLVLGRTFRAGSAYWARRLAVLAMGLGAVATGRAQLQWETIRAEVTAKLEQRSVEAVYRFKNAGAAPVRIDAVHTSCGCTTAGLSKTTYAPGEVGELRVRFDTTGRSGEQRKTITVTSDAAPTTPTQLTLVVALPEPLTVEPRLLLWSRQGEPSTKRFTVRTASAEDRVEVQADNPAFVVETRYDAIERATVVLVTPVSAEAPTRTSLRVTTQRMTERSAVVLVEARVQ
jgi:hypothetical protein